MSGPKKKCPACGVRVLFYGITLEGQTRMRDAHFPDAVVRQCPESWRVHIEPAADAEKPPAI